MSRRAAPKVVGRGTWWVGGVLVVTVALGCGRGPAAPPDGESRSATGEVRRHPWIVIGVDGGEWKLVERMWQRGRLPTLRALAERGSRGRLTTDYRKSPVIWTTVATGRRAPEHGITDFVIQTPGGLVPVSSAQRRVPALWNMTTTAGRRVAVVGWWASWPAEAVDGVVISDRALMPDLDHRVHPSELTATFDREASRLDETDWPDLGSSIGARRDLAMRDWAVRLADDGFDLMLVYFRSPDLISHERWRFVEPESYAPATPAETAYFGDQVPRVYEAVDASIAAILAAAPADANVLVMSDHGFEAREEALRVEWDPRRLLEELGFAARGADGRPDRARSRVVPLGPAGSGARPIRVPIVGRDAGATTRPEQKEEVLAALGKALDAVRWQTGERAFRLRSPHRAAAARGADAEIATLRRLPTRRLFAGERELDGVIVRVGWLTGTHKESTAGMMIVAGPDVEGGVRLDGMSIFDVAPTLLYGMDLPVADDFAGRAWIELFGFRFRAASPVRRIASWGAREAAESTPAAGDEELVEELRALGYLN